MPNIVTSEPIGASTVATIISFLAAKFAFNVDGPTATAVALVVLAVASWIARALSVPIAKHNATVAAAVAGAVSAAPQTAPPVVSMPPPTTPQAAPLVVSMPTPAPITTATPLSTPPVFTSSTITSTTTPPKS